MFGILSAIRRVKDFEDKVNDVARSNHKGMFFFTDNCFITFEHGNAYYEDCPKQTVKNKFGIYKFKDGQDFGHFVTKKIGKYIQDPWYGDSVENVFRGMQDFVDGNIKIKSFYTITPKNSSDFRKPKMPQESTRI